MPLTTLSSHGPKAFSSFPFDHICPGITQSLFVLLTWGFSWMSCLTLFTQREEEILSNSLLLISDGQWLLCVRNSSWGGLAALLTFIPCCNFCELLPLHCWGNRAFLIPLFGLGNGGLKGFLCLLQKSFWAVPFSQALGI